MASALLRFRRGMSVPTTLNISEPFWDETNDVLIIGTTDGGSTDYITLTKLNDSNNGSFSLTGDISASNATFTGTVNITNDIVIGGSIILGDNPVDEISLNGVLSGSMIPTTGSTFNIGAPSTPYDTIYADNAIFTNFTASAVEYSDILNKPTLISGSSQIDHNTTTNYLAAQHVNHTTTNINSGNGLSGGGNIASSRTLTLNTGSLHFVSGSKRVLNLNAVVSGSSQLTGSFDTRYVNTVGTPVDSQIGVWTGDGTLSGSIGLTYDNSNSLLKLFSSQTNNQSSYFRITENSATSYTGGYLRYNGVGNIFYIGTHDIDNALTSSDVPFLEVTRGSTSVEFQGDITAIGDITGSNILATSFVKDGSTANDVLLGDGTTTSLASLGGIPSGVVSGSSQLTASYDERYELSGSAVSLSSGLVSGSDQLSGSFVDFQSNQYSIGGEKTFTGAAVIVDNRFGVDTPIFGGSRLGDSNFQTPIIDTTSILFKTASQVTVAGMFLNPAGDTLTVKGFDDSIMITDFTSIAGTSGSTDSESTITNTVEFSNGHRYIDDKGIRIYPGGVSPVSQQFYQLFQNRDGAERMGYYQGFFDGTTYDRIYSITPSGSVEFENNISVTGSISASTFIGDGSGLTNLPVINPTFTGSVADTQIAFANGTDNLIGSSSLQFSNDTLSLNGSFDVFGITDIYRFNIDPNNLSGPLIQLGNTTDPDAYFTIQAAAGTNQFETKNRNFNVRTTAHGDVLTVSSTLAAVGINQIPSINSGLEISGSLVVSGSIEATGEITAFAASDERLKKNIELISDPLDRLQLLRGITWEWEAHVDESQKKSSTMGVSAQDIEKALPELVRTRDNGYLAVDYPKIVGLLIETNKELLKKIESLEKRMDGYDSDNTAIKGRN